MNIPRDLKHLNAKQWTLYMRTWLEVQHALTTFGKFSSKEAEEERHQITIEALGMDKSSKEFTNRDLDRVLDKMGTYLIRKDHTQPPATLIGEKKRLLWRIQNGELTTAQVRGLCERSARAFGHRTDFENFDETALRKLRFQVIQIERQNRAKDKTHASEPAHAENPF